MKKYLVTLSLLLLSLAASAQTSQKVIKDPAEYNNYMGALNLTDAGQKATAMEAFLTLYPNRVVKQEALEQAMAAYQQVGNAAKVADTAGRVLEVQPDHVRALAILAFLKRAQATQGDPKAAAEALSYAQRGLKVLPTWQKPEGTPDADFQQQRQQMTAILNGAAGFGSLQAKDYAAAQGYYLSAVEANPGDLQDVYQLSVAELEMQPLNPNGFWHVARAMQLAGTNAAARQAIEKYGRSKYSKYHGGRDGWDEIVAAAATRSAPPADFAKSVKPALTPAEMAVKAVAENEPSKLSFSDWEFILNQRDASPANQEAAGKVWSAIQTMQKGGTAKLKLPVVVLSVTREAIQAAITEENQQSKTPDLMVMLEKPLVRPAAVGAKISVIGVITSYTAQPFIFTMEKGGLP